RNKVNRRHFLLAASWAARRERSTMEGAGQPGVEGRSWRNAPLMRDERSLGNREEQSDDIFPRSNCSYFALGSSVFSWDRPRWLLAKVPVCIERLATYLSYRC